MAQEKAASRATLFHFGTNRSILPLYPDLDEGHALFAQFAVLGVGVVARVQLGEVIERQITEIKGVGRRYSNVVLKKADIDLTKRAGELSEEEVSSLT